MKTRANILESLTENPDLDVLVIGGGVNGIGTYRDLALQGLRVALVEKDDFCSGASAASSHMLHGGIRYLEYGEFRLVKEALHERNLLLKNAPHYAKPLPTTVPIFRWFSGFFAAPLKFVGLLDRPAERGALLIKVGLTVYDWFTGSQQTMPYHRFRGRKSSLSQFPSLNPEIICTATYYDAWMPNPERLCMDMLVDTDAASDQAFALNYAKAVGASGDSVMIQDEITGESIILKPKVVINAAGPWIDFVNQAMQQPTRFIGGTKGSHLILDHPELHAAANGSEIFFENTDGRIVLILPFHNRVMVGTTDIRIDDPQEAVCTEEEVDYFLGMVGKVFPNLKVDRSHIVYRFSGVRPLPAAELNSTAAISRDHHIQTAEAGSELAFPILSLVSGKWTTFRAFSEQAADAALQKLGQTRKASTQHLPIGGGKDFPTNEAGRMNWIKKLHQESKLPIPRLAVLLERYGTRAKEIALYIKSHDDKILKTLPDYSSGEIMYLAQQESVVHLDDFLLRRSAIAMLGYLSLNPACLEEIGNILASALNWTPDQTRQELDRTRTLLAKNMPEFLSAAAVTEG
jgi:glycerol-3-phosphate dehydrogenase